MKKTERNTPHPIRTIRSRKADAGGAPTRKPQNIFPSLDELCRSLPGKVLSTEQAGGFLLITCETPTGPVRYSAKRVLADAEQAKLEQWSDQRQVLAVGIRDLGQDVPEESHKRYEHLGELIDAMRFGKGRYELLSVNPNVIDMNGTDRVVAQLPSVLQEIERLCARARTGDISDADVLDARDRLRGVIPAWMTDPEDQHPRPNESRVMFLDRMLQVGRRAMDEAWCSSLFESAIGWLPSRDKAKTPVEAQEDGPGRQAETQETVIEFTPLILADRLGGVSPQTVGNWAKKAGVARPGQGQRNFVYKGPDLLKIVDYVIQHVPSSKSRKDAVGLRCEILPDSTRVIKT